MIVTIGGTKGGSGKSTLATNLAACLANEGVDFVLVDTDTTQASSAKWAERRDALRKEFPAIPKVNCVQKMGNVYETLRELDSKYSVVLVDAGGHDSKELRTAITASDRLYIPLGASILDLETLDIIEGIVSQSKEVMNPGLEVSAILTNAPLSRNYREIMEAKDYYKDYSDFLVLCENTICNRPAYRLCVRDGRGVIELENAGPAKAEVQLLFGEIFDVQ